jgi:hypothetical protein
MVSVLKIEEYNSAKDVKDSKNNSINIIVGLTFEPKLPQIL